jgi:hypothetical protein
VRGEKRQKIGEEMLHTFATNWRRERLNENVVFGQKEPSTLPSLRVCRAVRQEAVNRKHNLPSMKDPVLTIASMKYEQNYVGDIHMLSYDKFFVHYWTKEQVYVYKRYWSQSSFPRVQVDATGSLVLKLKRPMTASSHIFLYEIVINFNETQLSVCQMLSESHDTATIMFWISKWLKDVTKIPKECVCDFSYALLGAISRSYNDCSLDSYIERCMSLLLGSSMEIPKCYIRIDIAHLVKAVAQWKCYPPKANLVKQFFLRCIGLLVKCSAYGNLKKLVHCILVLAECETINHETHGWEESKTYLCKCIQNESSEFTQSYFCDVNSIDSNWSDN